MRPNRRPSAQTPSPPISNVRPFQPRKETVERSGTTRFASPPAWVTCSARAGSPWPASATQGITPTAPTNITPTIRRLTNFCTVALISPLSTKNGSGLSSCGFWVLRSGFWGLGSTCTHGVPEENDGLYSELLHAVVGLPPPHARGKGHPPGQEYPYPFLDRDLGKRGAAAFRDDDVP